MSELSLARIVVQHFQREGWEVYEEVDAAAGCADLVVTRGPLLGVVECKQSFGFAVLDQCVRWRPYAHLVWAATWHPKGAGSHTGHILCRHLGVGHLTVDRTHAMVREVSAPELHRRVDHRRIRDRLRPEHQNGQYARAGSQSARRWTPWRHTCEQLAAYVRKHPGCLLKEAVESIEHHYTGGDKAARATLAMWARRGMLEGVQLVRDGRRLRLRPAVSQAAQDPAAKESKAPSPTTP